MELYRRIKMRREELDMSQDELAAKVGYKSRSTIAKIESGINDIPQSKLKTFAQALETTVSYLMGWDENYSFTAEYCNSKKRVKATSIPVLGKVAAGIPIEAIENIEDYEEISESMANNGEYFALKIQGTSMEPKFSEGDIIIARKQDDIESGEIGVVMVNGSTATVKKIIKQEKGILLVATNQSVFPPKFYDNQDIENLPVKILGKVVELRAKF